MELSETRLISGLPSWAPNWSTPAKATMLRGQQIAGRTGFSRSGVRADSLNMIQEEDGASYVIDRASKQFVVAGLCVDTVRTTTKALETDFSWTLLSTSQKTDQWLPISPPAVYHPTMYPTMRFTPIQEELDFVMEAWKQAKQTQNWLSGRDNPTQTPHVDFATYESEEELLDSVCTTLSAGEENWMRTGLAGGRPWFWRHFKDSVYKATTADRASRWLSQSKPYYTDDPRHDFQNGLTTNCTWRKFFTTAKGYMGLGPSSMEAGDCVVLLFGLVLPLIVRPHGPGHNFIVGECYVHTLDPGEIISRWKATGDAADTFCLL